MEKMNWVFPTNYLAEFFLYWIFYPRIALDIEFSFTFWESRSIWKRLQILFPYRSLPAPHRLGFDRDTCQCAGKAPFHSKTSQSQLQIWWLASVYSYSSYLRKHSSLHAWCQHWNACRCSDSPLPCPFWSVAPRSDFAMWVHLSPLQLVNFYFWLERLILTCTPMENFGILASWRLFLRHVHVHFLAVDVILYCNLFCLTKKRHWDCSRAGWIDENASKGCSESEMNNVYFRIRESIVYERLSEPTVLVKFILYGLGKFSILCQLHHPALAITFS